MRESNLSKNTKTFKIGLKEIYKLNHWVLPIVIFDALFKSIASFINIYMSSKIIDELLGAKDIKRLVLLVSITIGSNLIVHLISTGLGHLKDMLVDITMQNQRMRLNEKIINMDYEYVENPKVHNLRTKIWETNNMNGGGIRALIDYTWYLIKGLVTVITSIVLVIDLFRVNTLSSGHISFINSVMFSYIFIALILVGTIFGLRLRTTAEKKGFGYFSKIMDVNRIFWFYVNQIYDYNSGKGVRLYNQKGIYNNEIDNFGKNSKNVFTSIGNMNAKYFGLEAFITSFLGGMVYVFVGLKALAGAITIGSIVKYAGSINQFMEIGRASCRERV